MPVESLTSPAPVVTPLLFTRREAARMLAISERTLWTLTCRGELAAVRIGRAVRYSLEDLRAFCDKAKGHGATR
jgi:excisionase family DNA binding protein